MKRRTTNDTTAPRNTGDARAARPGGDDPGRTVHGVKNLRMTPPLPAQLTRRADLRRFVGGLRGGTRHYDVRVWQPLRLTWWQDREPMQQVVRAFPVTAVDRYARAEVAREGDEVLACAARLAART